jgi:predicted DNA-binding transcriptional regulator YafY
MLLLLQARGHMTADELATELEVSVRTIYRDAMSLQIAGVPLQGESGHTGGYELSGGYRTNLTGLTTDEAAALFLAGLPGPAADLGMGGSVSTLRRKLVAALPAEQRRSATRMSQRFHLDAPGWYQDTDRPPHLAAVTDAVLTERRVRVRYSSWERVSTKTLEPYGLVLKGGRWYLIAVASRPHSRPSTYRVDQIVDIAPLDQTFSRPDDFDLAACWSESVRSFRDRLRSGTAVIKLSPNGQVRYRQLTSEAAVATGESAGVWVTATVPIESIDHAHGLLLQLGADVEVVEPIALRALIAATARQLADLYDADR